MSPKKNAEAPLVSFLNIIYLQVLSSKLERKRIVLKILPRALENFMRSPIWGLTLTLATLAKTRKHVRSPPLFEAKLHLPSVETYRTQLGIYSTTSY